jgi:hypothetical protein
VRHLRMLGLCLIACCAVVAVGATSAAALPEWGQCVAKEGGKYSESNCVAKASKGSGKFEFKKATTIAKKKFVGEGGAGVLAGKYGICEPSEERKPACSAEEHEIFFTGETPTKVECENEVNHGEISGTKEVKNVSVTFHGCKALGTVPCSNSNAEGEIKVNTLKGTLGYINKSTKEVGVLLEPATKKGEFAKFTCLSGALSTVVGMGNSKEGCAYPLNACGGDGIISPITPINQMTSKFTQVFTINENQENVPNKFEGKPLKVLESYLFNAEEPAKSSKWSKSGETITNVNTGEEEAEIRA